MASLTDLAREHTDLADSEIDHLQRLVASWGLLADLSFSDLMLFAERRPASAELGPDPYPGDSPGGGAGNGAGIVVLGQVRPSTSQTLYRRDWVGRILHSGERPTVMRALMEATAVEGEATSDSGPSIVRETCIPVIRSGRVIAALAKETAERDMREPGELERTYLDVFDRFATMIAAGVFPFTGDDDTTDDAPRVGDGAIVLGADMSVVYASPNAVSALNRIGVHSNSEGRRFSELGLPEAAVHAMFATKRPTTEELEKFEQKTGLSLLVAPVALDAVEVLVHPSNQMRTVSFDTLRLIFAEDSKGTGYWDPESGLHGPILVSGGSPNWGTSRFFAERALGGSGFRKGMHTLDVAYEDGIEAFVACNQNAIGFAQHRLPRTKPVKVLPIGSDSAAVAVDARTVNDGSYPLTRYLYLIVAKDHSSELPDNVRRFADLLLSLDGQCAVADAGSFPLSAETLRAARQKLGLP